MTNKLWKLIKKIQSFLENIIFWLVALLLIGVILVMAGSFIYIAFFIVTVYHWAWLFAYMPTGGLVFGLIIMLFLDLLSSWIKPDNNGVYGGI
jgi:hypothetical protein